MGQLSPKTYADEAEESDQQYEWQINHLQGELREAFEKTKAAADFLIIVTTQVGLGALFWLLLQSAKTSSLATKPVLGLIATGIFSAYLFLRVGRIVDLFIQSTLLSTAQVLGYRYDSFESHVVFRAIWKSMLVTLQMVALWGLGFAAVELAKGQFLK